MLKDLEDCFMDWDPELVDVTDANWYGIRSYANQGGNPGIDDWEPCPDNTAVSLCTQLKGKKGEYINFAEMV